MRVKVANTSGFCMGVRRAVAITVDASREYPPPIYTLGPLIHNPQVISMFRERGVEVARDMPDHGAVVIRSHGVRPEIKKKARELGLPIVNATCPNVTRVQGIAKRRAGEGFLVVLLGDPGHAEVEGILGYSGDKAVLVQGPDDVADLPAAEKVCLVSQTTQERERFEAVARAIRERYSGLGEGNLIVADTICDSTRNRQDEVRRLAREVEAMVVVGGKASANTGRLAEVAQEEGIKAYKVETEEELDPEEMSRYRVVGLTAGASTPNWMIRRVHDRLHEIGASRDPLHRLIGFLSLAILGNVYVAIGGAALTYASMKLQGMDFSMAQSLVSALFIFAVHTMTLMSDSRALAFNVPARARSFTRHKNKWVGAGAAAAALAIFISFFISRGGGAFLVALAVVSFLYPVKLTKKDAGSVPIRRLADVPGSKDIFMAFGWSALIVVLPLFKVGFAYIDFFAALASLIMVGGLAFARALLRDFRDIQADRMIGRETLPIVLGVTRTREVLIGALALTSILIAGATFLGWVHAPLGYYMLFPLLYSAACVPVFTRRTLVQGFGAEALIDATFLIAGLAALIA